jgi:CHASE3 domain sensor protein
MNRRNALLLAALFAVIAVIVGSALVTLQNMRAMRTVTAMREVYLCVQEAETAERGFLIDQDQAEFIPYQRAINALQPRLAEVKKLLADYPDQLARLSSLQTLALAQVQQMDEILALAKSGARDEAFAKAKAEGVKAQMEQLRRCSLKKNDSESLYAASAMGSSWPTARVRSST